MLRARSSCCRTMAVTAMTLLFSQRAAGGQADMTPATPNLRIQTAEGCTVVATTNATGPAARRRISVDGNRRKANISDSSPGGAIVAFLAEPVTSGNVVVLTYGEMISDPFTVNSASVLGCQEPPGREFPDDDRDAFETPFFVGAAYEQFAPGYSDPNQDAQAARAIAGVYGQFRLFRRKEAGRWPFQLWLFGGFLAGLRSYCSSDGGTSPPPADPGSANEAAERLVCRPFDTDNIGSANTVIRNATSFEVSIGARVEFLALNIGSKFAANGYVLVRDLRFSLDRATENKLSDPVIAIGFVLTNGAMRGTSFQAGVGSSRLYAGTQRRPPWNRSKIDFTLSVGAAKTFKEKLTFWDKTKNSMRYFFAVRTDFDEYDSSDHKGPDSVRVATGISFAPTSFFGWK